MEITDIGARRLAAAIVKSTAQDYVRECKSDVKKRERYFDKMEILSAFYGEWIRPAQGSWREPRTETWARWASPQKKSSTMIQCEIFFTSEYGELLTEGDPVYIMNQIRKRTGLKPFTGSKTWKDEV